MDDSWIDKLKPNEAAASAEQLGKFHGGNRKLFTVAGPPQLRVTSPNRMCPSR